MTQPQRYTPAADTGLNEAQVRERVENDLTNEYASNTTKSYGQILKEHFFTFYNILNIVLAALLLAVGAYKDTFFMVIVVANFLIGVIQEFSSKRTLDKLALIVAARVNVIRDGQKNKIRVGGLVLDDVIELKTGNQIAADSIVLDGYLEVNESLLSGESDVIVKKQGDFLYSGSFVVSGTARARVDRVGADCYANQISSSAKAAKKRKSELYSTLGAILRIISYILIPLGIMLFYKQNVVLGLIPEEAVVKTVAALIGMIPEGLILMTSIAFVASVIFLANDNTLVQDMYGIETLARVDIICLDKTGTLTEGRLDFEQMVSLTGEDYTAVMSNICGASEDENATMAALKKQFPAAHDYPVTALIPFSSARKYSGVVFAQQGAWILGATDFIFPNSHAEVKRQAEELARDGRRVILLAHSDSPAEGNALPPGLEPAAFLYIADRIRDDARTTLEYFYNYDVDIKIISGDHPKTVAHIAREAGVRNADECVDASTLETHEQLKEAVLGHSIFGRVSPAQKKEMVDCMKESGHKVAMMGDGVNDVLALKAADCAVAVAAGSDAAKNVSDIVLMDSSLAHLLHVVEDGRKIINNIQRVATLFITKTVYSVLLAFATLFLFDSAYPFTPIQLTFISFVTIGAPSFFLALEPQYSRVKGQFILNVLRKSLPGGLCIMLGIIIVNILASAYGYTPQELTTMCLFIATAGGMWVLLKVSRPMTWLRKAVLIGMTGLIVLGTVLFHEFFSIYPINPIQIAILAAICALMPLVTQFMEWLITKVNGFIEKKAAHKKRAFEERLNSMHQRKS